MVGELKLRDLTVDAVPGINEVFTDALNEVDKAIELQEKGLRVPDAPVELTLKITFARKDGGQIDVSLDPSLKVPRYVKTGCTAKKRGRGAEKRWKFVEDEEQPDMFEGEVPKGVRSIAKPMKKEDQN